MENPSKLLNQAAQRTVTGTVPGPSDIVELIGNTPLLRLPKLTAHLKNVEIYAKAEWYNPGGSVKDRPALNMILDGERRDLLTKDKILLDATSGNTGIAYAMICAAKGYQVHLCMPQNASIERKRILKAYGAKLILTDAMDGSDGAQREAKRLYAENPDVYFYPDQYNNPANWQAHYQTTAPEIWTQTNGRVTHYVAGLGTSGTFTGTARRLREFNPEIKCYSFQPDSPLHGLEGMKHMPTSIVPGIYDPELADGNIEVATEDAHRMVRWMAKNEGLLIGISAGGAATASLKLAEQLEAAGESGVIVTIFPDAADKYLSEHFWEDED